MNTATLYIALLASVLVYGCETSQIVSHRSADSETASADSEETALLTAGIAIEAKNKQQLNLTGESAIAVAGAFGTVSSCGDPRFAGEINLQVTGNSASLRVPAACAQSQLNLTKIVARFPGASGDVLFPNGIEVFVHADIGTWRFDATDNTLRRISQNISSTTTINRPANEVSATISILTGSGCDSAALVATSPTELVLTVRGSFPETSVSSSQLPVTFSGVTATTEIERSATWSIAVPLDTAAGSYSHNLELEWEGGKCQILAKYDVAVEAIATPASANCFKEPLVSLGAKICAGGPTLDGASLNYCQIQSQLPFLAAVSLPQTCAQGQCLMVAISANAETGAQTVVAAECVQEELP